MKTLIRLSALILGMALGFSHVSAQNLTAKQLNLYFGQPKSVIVTNGQGSSTTEFDKQGRITNIRQGVMKMLYDWSEDGKQVTLSAYQGDNFMDSVTIDITELSKSRYQYTIGEAMTYDITFTQNGALDTLNMTSSMGSMSMTYLYHNSSDMYPYAIEQKSGDQLMRIQVTVNSTDSYGNPTAYTQELMGNKDITRLEISYY